MKTLSFLETNGNTEEIVLILSEINHKKMLQKFGKCLDSVHHLWLKIDIKM